MISISPLENIKKKKIQVRKENFFKLWDVLMDISFNEKISVPKCNNFQVTPLSNIEKRFNNYIQSLSSIKTDDVSFFIEKKLILLLKKVQDIFNKNPTRENERFLLRILGVVTGHHFIGPEWFHLDISNPCNIDCNYCWFYSKYLQNPPSTDFKKSMISFNDFKIVIDDLAKLETDTVLFSGAGEPMLHPKINEMIPYVKSKGLNLQIFTNGTKLDEKIAETIVKTKTDELFISVSASNPKTYVRVHPNQNKKIFFQTENNIKKLIKLKQSSNQDEPNIILLFVLCRDNYKDIREMADWSYNFGQTSVRYQLAHNDDAKIIELSEEKRELVEKQIKDVFEKYKNKMQINSNIMFQLDNTKTNTEWYNSHYIKKGCYVGWFFSRLWADSMVSFCCIRKEIEHIKHRNSYQSLWKSDLYRNYRNVARSFGKNNILLKKNYYLIDKDCSHCGNYEVNEKIYTYLKEKDFLRFL